MVTTRRMAAELAAKQQVAPPQQLTANALRDFNASNAGQTRKTDADTLSSASSKSGSASSSSSSRRRRSELERLKENNGLKDSTTLRRTRSQTRAAQAPKSTVASEDTLAPQGESLVASLPMEPAVSAPIFVDVSRGVQPAIRVAEPLTSATGAIVPYVGPQQQQLPNIRDFLAAEAQRARATFVPPSAFGLTSETGAIVPYTGGSHSVISQIVHPSAQIERPLSAPVPSSVVSEPVLSSSSKVEVARRAHSDIGRPVIIKEQPRSLLGRIVHGVKTLGQYIANVVSSVFRAIGNFFKTIGEGFSGKFMKDDKASTILSDESIPLSDISDKRVSNTPELNIVLRIINKAREAKVISTDQYDDVQLDKPLPKKLTKALRVYEEEVAKAPRATRSVAEKAAEKAAIALK